MKREDVKVGDAVRFVEGGRLKGETEMWWEKDGLKKNKKYFVDFIHKEDDFVILKDTPSRFFHHMGHFKV